MQSQHPPERGFGCVHTVQAELNRRHSEQRIAAGRVSAQGALIGLGGAVQITALQCRITGSDIRIYGGRRGRARDA